ncbi:hypothetical protein OIO90_001149 [Microbotryomycetes sp. JL221]|nr:hypothetical protein OIO90_001149 [Microbotryomycetes sp. JL221]
MTTTSLTIRGIVSVDMIIMQRLRQLQAEVVRSGKLIQQAKKLYGADEIGADQNADMNMLNGAADLASLGTAASIMSRTEDASLVGGQISQALEEYLIANYSFVYQGQCFVVDWDVFHSNWTDAGRMSARMSPTEQCLIFAMQAWAARFTDHPLVIGQDLANRYPSLEHFKESDIRDWSEVGNRRDAFARMMLDRALRKIDETGAFRKPSLASLTAFLLLGSRRDKTNPGRAMIMAVAEHLRAINDAATYVSDVPNEVVQPPERISGGTLLWTSYTRDALSAVTAGKPLTFSDADLSTFSELLSPSAQSLDIMPSISSNNPAVLAGLAVVCMFRHLTTIIRYAADKITGPAASRERLNESAVRHVWSKFDENAHFTSVFRDSVNKTDWGPQKPKSVAWFKDIVAMVAQATIGIHRAIVDRFETERSNVQAEVPDAAYFDMLRRLRDESAERFLDCIRELIAIIHGFGSSLLFECMTTCEYLVDYLQHMLDMPTWEQGGPRGWTYAIKRREVGWMIDAIQVMGWCWPGYDHAIERARNVLNECAAAEQAMSRLGPAHSSARSMSGVTASPNGQSPYPASAYNPPPQGWVQPYGVRVDYGPTDFDSTHLQHNPAFNGSAESPPAQNGHSTEFAPQPPHMHGAAANNGHYYDPSINGHTGPSPRNVQLPALPTLSSYGMKAESNERHSYGSSA